MLSPEFNSAIKNGNLLRVRIMLKDSLIVDPTFGQFNEMFAYARQALPTLLVHFDNGDLEDDCSKWDKDLMNMELVEIVNNFSEARIDHLKKVISIVLADKIRSAKTAKSQQHVQQQPQQTFGRPTYGVQMDNPPRSGSSAEIEEQKKVARKQALSRLTNSSKKIESVMTNMQNRGKWMLSDIQELENAANQILVAAKNYKNNR